MYDFIEKEIMVTDLFATFPWQDDGSGRVHAMQQLPRFAHVISVAARTAHPPRRVKRAVGVGACAHGRWGTAAIRDRRSASVRLRLPCLRWRFPRYAPGAWFPSAMLASLRRRPAAPEKVSRRPVQHVAADSAGLAPRTAPRASTRRS